MQKLNLFIFLFFGYLIAGAQTTVSDSVNTRPNNTSRVFYNLATGAKTTVSDTDWHLAFSVTYSQTVSAVTIRLNGENGVNAWVAENNDTSTFTNLDTTGMANWRRLIDNDANLGEGALNSNANPSNIFDFGWATYDLNTHDLIGDSVFLIQLPDGSYKKLVVEDLYNYDTTYDVKYANLDNTGLTFAHISKGNFPNKEFAYLNLVNNQVLDKEPVDTAWDLLFLKYDATNVAGLPPSYLYYPVGGVWVNPLITAARDSGGINVNTNGYSGLSFTNQLNTIGWNWVTYTGVYTPVDALDFFVHASDNNYYKLIFTGYGGDATGVFYFNKSAAVATAVADIDIQNAISIFPNPANETLNIVLSQPAQEVQIADINGQLVSDLKATEKVIPLNISALAPGVYVLSVKSSDNVSTSKFIVTR